jgi:hypothetical protein
MTPQNRRQKLTRLEDDGFAKVWSQLSIPVAGKPSEDPIGMKSVSTKRGVNAANVPRMIAARIVMLLPSQDR